MGMGRFDGRQMIFQTYSLIRWLLNYSFNIIIIRIFNNILKYHLTSGQRDCQSERHDNEMLLCCSFSLQELQPNSEMTWKGCHWKWQLYHETVCFAEINCEVTYFCHSVAHSVSINIVYLLFCILCVVVAPGSARWQWLNSFLLLSPTTYCHFK